MELFENIGTTYLKDQLSKILQDTYNINPKIVIGSSSSLKDAVTNGLPEIITSGIQCFSDTNLPIDQISLGFPMVGDNGVWDTEYNITFTDDATNSTPDGNLLRYEINNTSTLSYIGEHLFNNPTIFKLLDERQGLFLTSKDGDWSIEGYLDEGLFLYYFGSNRKDAINKMKGLKTK